MITYKRLYASKKWRMGEMHREFLNFKKDFQEVLLYSLHLLVSTHDNAATIG